MGQSFITITELKAHKQHEQQEFQVCSTPLVPVTRSFVKDIISVTHPPQEEFWRRTFLVNQG